MPPILTLTLSPALDKSCSVDNVVAGRKLRCGEPVYRPGGGGINVARAIKELGGHVVAYWTCGGAIGEFFKQLLDSEGLHHQPIAIDAMTRENYIVFEESSGQQFHFTMPGATVNETEIQSCLELLKSVDPPPEYLVLSGSLPTGVDNDVYARVANTMPPTCRVVLDTSRAALRLGLEASVFLAKPNLRELGELAGRPVENDSQIREITQSLIRDGKAQIVLTSIGAGGAILTTADDHRHIRAPTVKIRSKVGAGDSTVAGMIFALYRGKPVFEAACYGVAAGSAAVMNEGTELCHRSDTERLFQEMIK
jgi:6-phosphofructokinase 2